MVKLCFVADAPSEIDGLKVATMVRAQTMQKWEYGLM